MAKKQQQKEAQEPQVTNEELAEIEELTEGLGAAPDAEAESEVVAEVDQELQEELAASREEAQKNHDLYLRTLAEMDNLRKRSQREKEDMAKFGNESILREILPVIDNLERAVQHAAEGEGNSGLLEGVEMTLDQFGKVLEKFGVQPLEAMGQSFDPAHHQAMGQLETDEYPVNTVAQELQTGYLLNQRLLRPSLVMVAKAPAPVEKADDEAEQQENKD